MEQGKIVIIEGTSCTGKTTLCKKLQKEANWVIIPEAIRYLEKSTGKQGDEASPLPFSEDDEKYNQEILFNVELQKIREANELAKNGKNVIIDKCAIATMATAYAFEKLKKFEGTFDYSLKLYKKHLDTLENENLKECDIFVLLTCDYDKILLRNKMRNHVLEELWVDEKLINYQEMFLKSFTRLYKKEKMIIDTSNDNIPTISKMLIDKYGANKDDIER